MVDQLGAVMRSSTFIAGGESAPNEGSLFADVLDSVAGAARLFGDIHSVQDLQEQNNGLQRCIDDARRATRDISEHLSPERLEEP